MNTKFHHKICVASSRFFDKQHGADFQLFFFFLFLIALCILSGFFVAVVWSIIIFVQYDDIESMCAFVNPPFTFLFFAVYSPCICEHSSHNQIFQLQYHHKDEADSMQELFYCLCPKGLSCIATLFFQVLFTKVSIAVLGPPQFFSCSLLSSCCYFQGSCTLGWSEKNFLFPITFPGVRKVGIWSKNMLESGFAWLHAKWPCYLPLVVRQTQVLQNLS